MYQINGRLIFTDSSSNVPTGYDEVTGEPIFSVAESSVEVSIEDAKGWVESLLAGTDEKTSYLMGRCVNPKQLTQSQRRQRRAKIVLNVGDVGVAKDKIVGFVELTPAIQSRLGLDNYFGERIEGSVALTNLDPV